MVAIDATLFGIVVRAARVRTAMEAQEAVEGHIMGDLALSPPQNPRIAGQRGRTRARLLDRRDYAYGRLAAHERPVFDRWRALPRAGAERQAALAIVTDLPCCDCHEHPGVPERCSPIRGGFRCDGTYRMPDRPDGCPLTRR